MSGVVPLLRDKMSSKDYPAAIAAFEADKASTERDLVARLLYAEALFQAKRMPEALVHATETRSLFPSDIRVLLDLGFIHFRLGDDRAALDCFDHARRHTPANMWPYYRIAQIHRRRRDVQAEVDILRAAEAKCHGRILDSEYQAILKELASAKSLLAVSAVPGFEARLLSRAGHAPVLNDCVHVTMVKDEEDVIHSCLSASYRSGFRKFVVADNGSVDATQAEIRRFAQDHPDATTFVVSDPVVGYYQDIKTMALVNYAATVFEGLGTPIRWAFPMDADEALRAFADGATLREMVDAADSQDARMIVFAWSHAASPEPLRCVDPSRSLDEAFPLRSTLGRNIVRKCAFRIGDGTTVEVGAHFIRNCARREADMLIAAEHGFAMVHYPVRSIEQAKRKTINGYKALEAASGLEKMGGHWRADHDSYLAEGEAFFERKVAAYIERVRTDAF